MKVTRIGVGLLAIALGVGTAQAIEVHQTATVKGAPDALWQKIGEFCAIQTWHPAAKKCEISEEGGVTFRTLTLPDGGLIKEKLLEQTPTSYSYEIVESPLPVQNYKSTFSVMAHGDSAMVDWVSTFDAKGMADAEAEGVIAGILKAGLDQIGAMNQ
jgi:hypothetical protein